MVFSTAGKPILGIYAGIQERRVIWDISVIAYMINKEWFETEEVSCPNIKPSY